MKKENLIGTWDVDGGYKEEPNGARLLFQEDGSGILNPHGDRINILWSIEENKLKLHYEENSYGPFEIEIIEEEFPMGTYLSLKSKSSLLPFGIKNLQKIDSNQAG